MVYYICVGNFFLDSGGVQCIPHDKARVYICVICDQHDDDDTFPTKPKQNFIYMLSATI